MGIVFPKEVIIAYIEKYIGETDIKDNGDWLNINSIFAEDSRKRMGFNVSKNWVSDYKSGGSWSLEKFVAEHLDLEIQMARKTLLTLFFSLKKGGAKISAVSRENVETTEKKELVELSAISSYLVPPSRSFSEKFEYKQKALNFLKSKNLTEKHINKFNLKVVDQKKCWHCESAGDVDCPICKGTGNNPYFGRIYIPTTENGNLVYFQTRSFLGSELRYRNLSGEKKNVVYFYDLIEKDAERVCVLEGASDAMTLSEENAISIMGPSMSYGQILKLLSKTPKSILFIPDFDPKEETRNKILKLLAKNIKKIREVATYPIKIAIYEWYKIPEVKSRLLDQMRYPDRYEESELKKDISDFGLITIEDIYIKYIQDDKMLILREKIRGAS